MKLRLRLLARNALLNFVGHAAPLGRGALSRSRSCAHSLGTERFGMLSLAWVLVGYFSLFDLGLGRALTHAVAQGEGSSDPSRAIPGLVNKGLAAMLALGLAAGAGDVRARSVALHKCPASLRTAGRARRSPLCKVLAVLRLPFVTVTAGRLKAACWKRSSASAGSTRSVFQRAF